MQSFRRLTAAPAIRSFLARPPTVSSRQFVRRLTQSNHTHGTRSSDLPWIIGAVGFTIPASFYLLSSPSKPAHHPPAGHGHGHDDGHATEAKDSKAANVAPKEDEDSSPEEAEPTKQLDSTDSKDEGAGESSSDTHNKESETTEKTGEKAAEATGKGEGEGEGEGEATGKSDEHTGKKVSNEDETKSDGEKVEGEEDGKGETSDDVGKKPTVKKEKTGKETKSQTLERLNREKSNRKPSDIDPPAAGMKDVASPNMQSGKQEGISNNDTWHSVLHSERGQSISKKAEGAHQTAKLKGTVDPFRPADYDATKK